MKPTIGVDFGNKRVLVDESLSIKFNFCLIKISIKNNYIFYSNLKILNF